MGLDARAQWNARRGLNEAERFYVGKLEDLKREKAAEVGHEEDDTSLWRRDKGYEVHQYLERGDQGEGVWDGIMLRWSGDDVHVKAEVCEEDEVRVGEENGERNWSSRWAMVLRTSLGLE
jgi:hypothetical protein